MSNVRHDLVLRIVRHGWVVGHRHNRQAQAVVRVRRALAWLILVTSVVLFCWGLLGLVEDSRDVAFSGPYIEEVQGGETQAAGYRGVWIHPANGGPGRTAGGTMKRSAFQGEVA